MNAIDIIHTEGAPSPKLTLFGTLAKAYNDLCENVKRISGDITCNVKGNIESIKTYINTNIANPDEREYLKQKATEYSKSLQEITKDVTDTTIKTTSSLSKKASSLTKRAYAPEDPREALRALYVLENRITNVINETLEVPSIDVKTMEDLLELDTVLYDNRLNKLIELIFTLYNKNVLGSEEYVTVSKTQKLLFIGYLFCEPLPQDITGKNIEESPIPYNVLLDTKVMSGDEINEEFERICKFEKEVNVEDTEQAPATTVFEKVPLDENEDVVMVRPAKKMKIEGGKKSKKRITKKGKNAASKTKKNKRSSKKKDHKKK